MTILFPINSPVVTILIQIVRGTQLTDLLVYSANLTIPGIGTDGALIFPLPDDQLIYTAGLYTKKEPSQRPDSSYHYDLLRCNPSHIFFD
ncbi:hypothetical protein HQN89_06075 [Paenibacillus frigoriresistens]|nr:hypothetical protein [Paenibacillus frigoriresistens]